jgi:hypothetical protein
MTKRQPRGTGYCTGCDRRILLTTQGKLFLHAVDPKVAYPVHCKDSMTRNYKPGPDRPR